jgi:hypothetical protein
LIGAKEKPPGVWPRRFSVLSSDTAPERTQIRWSQSPQVYDLVGCGGWI